MDVFKKVMDWYQGNDDRETEPPRGGMKRVWYLLINYAGKLVIVNVLFLICCSPVFTIPAALSALNCYVGKLFRVGYGMEFSDYWKEFRESLWKNIPLGIVNGVIAFYAYYLLSLAGNFAGSAWEGIVTGIGLGVAAALVLLGSYSFLLTSVLDLPGRYILKNAGILIFLEWRSSLLLILETIIFWGIILVFVPYTILPLLLVGFSLHHLILHALLWPGIRKRIIDPFEEGK